MIRPITQEDVPFICSIYNHYIEHTIITFEEQPVSVEEMIPRITDITQNLPWLVWDDQGQILGYAYASPWKGRCAYRFSVESTIYLHHQYTGQGIGLALYQALLAELRSRSFHTVMGGIALPNPQSIALHEKVGFEKVAHFQEVGWKFHRWIDVGYWQLKLS